jgi:hypothetical protein
MPAEICNPDAALLKHGLDAGFYRRSGSKIVFMFGFYRELNTGKKEFLSFCSPEASKYLSIYGPKFKELLDAWLPEKRK